MASNLSFRTPGVPLSLAALSHWSTWVFIPPRAPLLPNIRDPLRDVARDVRRRQQRRLPARPIDSQHGRANARFETGPGSGAHQSGARAKAAAAAAAVGSPSPQFPLLFPAFPSVPITPSLSCLRLPFSSLHSSLAPFIPSSANTAFFPLSVAWNLLFFSLFGTRAAAQNSSRREVSTYAVRGTPPSPLDSAHDKDLAIEAAAAARQNGRHSFPEFVCFCPAF